MITNFGYCISEYLSNRYNIQLEEKLCCLLGSSIDLQLVRKNNPFETPHKVELDNFDFDQFYIESTNPLTLENFCTCFNSVLRFDHNNDFDDLKWIISDYHNLGKIKTLVLLSSKVLNKSQDHGNHLIYAVAHPINPEPAGYTDDTLKTSEIFLAFGKNISMTLTGAQLENLWKVSGSEVFNANRYVIIPPIYGNFEQSLPALICNALVRQYFHLTNKGDLVGPRLIRTLYQHLEMNPSEANKRSHRNLLLYSISKNSGFNLDMNRGYMADVYKFLHQQKIINCPAISTALAQSAEKWYNAYGELKANKMINLFDLKSIYRDFYDQEMRITNLLKEIVM